MMNKEFRIRCKCGVFIDSKVNNSKKFMEEHMKHMFGGKMENIYQIKINGELLSLDYHTAFDEEFVLSEIQSIMYKSEPDDVIEIINVSKNQGD